MIAGNVKTIKNIKRRIEMKTAIVGIVMAGSLIVMCASAFADMFVHGGGVSGWRTDGNRYTITDVYRK